MKKTWIIACAVLLAMGLAGAVLLAIGIARQASGAPPKSVGHSMALVGRGKFVGLLPASILISTQRDWRHRRSLSPLAERFSD